MYRFKLITFSIAAGQLFPVASTGMSSYLSKLIPVLVPENNSLFVIKTFNNKVHYISGIGTQTDGH